MNEGIVVVGGSGLVGTRLIRQLHSARVPVTSFDVIPGTIAGVPSEIVDICDAQAVTRAFGRVRPSTVIHLVARVDPPAGKGGRIKMRSLHLDGFRNVIAAATEVGATRLVHASSAVVYGAHEDNPVPLRESDRLRPRPDFPYAVDKAAQEQLLTECAGALSTASIRPAVIYAEEAKNYLTEILRYAPLVLPAIDGARPPLQFVHAEDVATALNLLAHSTSTGTYNVGPAAMAYDDVARACGLRVVPMPRRALAPAANFGARILPSRFRAPAYVLDQLAFPFVVDSTRIREHCGWAPVHSSASALADMLRGKPRPLTRSRLRRGR